MSGIKFRQENAEAAKIALQELSSEIKGARVWLAHVDGLEQEYLHAALIEIATKSGYRAASANSLALLSLTRTWIRFGRA